MVNVSRHGGTKNKYVRELTTYGVLFHVLDVGVASEPFWVSSRSLPNSITWAVITHFAVNRTPLVKLFDIM